MRGNQTSVGSDTGGRRLHVPTESLEEARPPAGAGAGALGAGRLTALSVPPQKRGT